MTATLQDMMNAVSASYPFVAQKYPELAKQDLAGQLAFAVRHSALHFAKGAGALAALSEAADHGAPLDQHALQKLSAKALINALKLAELADLSADELAQAVRDIFAQEQQQVAA